MNNEFKSCRACNKIKSLEEFHKNQNIDGRFNTCKQCQYNRLQEFRKDPQHKERFKRYSKDNCMYRRYGITLDQYEAMVIKQKNRCLICNNQPINDGARQNSSLHIDHCHITKKVRGLLCHLCNRGIGLFREKIELLEKAIKYLKKYT